ncbi:MAG: hypothetical protein ACOX61_05165 [Brooklawnia sp.]|jgi:hypothetical protein
MEDEILTETQAVEAPEVASKATPPAEAADAAPAVADPADAPAAEQQAAVAESAPLEQAPAAPENDELTAEEQQLIEDDPMMARTLRSYLT